MNKSNLMEKVFLVVGFLTVFEFMFIRGMFTWLIMCTLVVVTGGINIALSLKEKKVTQAAMFLLTILALCMGYISYL